VGEIMKEKARAALAALPLAISGQGGHDRTYHAACLLAKFGITGHQALELLQEFSRTHAIPEWNDAELLHKAADAEAQVRADGKFGIYCHNQGTNLITRTLSQVEAKQIRWLWKFRIALGKITIIVGDPGVGKSFLSIYMAVAITRGKMWPDGTRPPQGEVVLVSAEDDPEDTIKPRAERMGADLDKIDVIDSVRVGSAGEKSFSLDQDLPLLVSYLDKHPNCRLIIIDPISAYLGTDVDSHRNSDVRGLLAPLSRIAAKYNVAVVCITHMSKGAGGKAIYRSTGSLAFVAAARAAWLVAIDPDDETRRLFLMMKNNIAEPQKGLAYRIVDGRIVWSREPVDIKADEVLARDLEQKDSKSEVEETREWLEATLADGPLESTELLRQAKANGFSKSSLKRAKKLMPIKARRVGGVGPKGHWEWHLVPKEANPS
jgi:hypothetical protein